MCGISGFFSDAPVVREADEPVLLRMQEALRHRGPDGNGIAFVKHAAFAHNRLAIIDPAAGVQPLSDASGAVTIVFNGEIYNYRELRSRYPHFAYRTNSDTEVIVSVFMNEGIEGLTQLRGMFAIALWDARANKGWLLRDPVGIKPLFFCMADNRLYFGSEAKALLVGGALKPSLDVGSLHQLMNFRYVTGDASLFSQISQVPPGQILEWQPGSGTRRWTPSWNSQSGLSTTEAFTQAVSRHLVADVKVGCFLSGGIDSALIAAVACRQEKIETFTLDVGDDPLERQNAAETAALLGLPNTAFDFSLNDVVGFHQSLVKHLEAPKVNAVQSAILSEHAVRHTKVALSGLGGDELFLGYNAHRILWAAQSADRMMPFGMNRWLAGVFGGLVDDGIPWGERTRAVEMLRAMPNWGAVYGILRNVWDSPAMRRAVYGPRMLDANPPASFEWLSKHFPSGVGGVQAAREFEFRNKMVNDLLWNEDRVSMRVGLEVRVPFLDWDLVATCNRKSVRELMPMGRAKHALKSLARGIVPEPVLRRQKSGFQLDVVDASGSTLAPLFDAYLSDEAVHRHGLFSMSFVQEVMKHRGDRRWRWHFFLLYLMAQAHIFMDEYELS